MSLGSFETRLVASAKLTSMEKYGWAYNEDLLVVRGMLGDEVEIIDDGTGIIKIRDSIAEYTVHIRDYQQKKESAPIPPAPEREGKYISVWDVASH
ncbi:MAG: hypothetical protein KAW41_05640 [Candidatus Diapherotrites archaeon]|nr:hypothetical protein [Candidatus Diapherotrites archaeon]